ncbi:MAG: bifunctional metallophosphatase/5'-nucleotidase [Hydrogenibacillus sp.]|nr:bifunctional metallophosphatase/5'-nucleotidase [Hydrogenibacillus sp.]
MRITLIHSNDVHSRFEMMPKIAAYAERLRRERRGEAVWLIDLGDHVDRAHPLTESTAGEANARVLEASGYDFVTIGNNEGLSLSPKALAALYQGAPFDVLVANLFYAPDGRGEAESGGMRLRPEWARPYAVRAAAGRTIGFIGLTTPFMYYTLLGWNVASPQEVLDALIPELRPHVDALVVLSHLGYFVDRRLAEVYPEIDLILGAHTHHRFPEGVRVGRTVITQSGRGGMEVGRTELIWTDDRFTGGRPLIRTRTIAVGKEADASAVRQALAAAEAAGRSALSRPVARLSRPLPVAYDRESPFANVLARAVRRATEADAALLTSGLLLHDLRAGVISYGEVLTACPHPISPCVLTLSALELKHILNEALRPSHMMMSVRGYGFRGSVLGHPAVDGIEVVVVHKGGQSFVVRLEKDGCPLDDDAVLRVATADMFVFMRMDEALGRRIEEAVYCMPRFLRHYLTEELGRSADHAEAFRPRFVERWEDACGEGLDG